MCKDKINAPKKMNFSEHSPFRRSGSKYSDIPYLPCCEHFIKSIKAKYKNFKILKILKSFSQEIVSAYNVENVWVRIYLSPIPSRYSWKAEAYFPRSNHYHV